MRISKNGSVFYIVLNSGVGEYETRISFAVNSHEDMRRPRLEVSQGMLLAIFREMLPHISASDLIEDKNWDLSVRRRSAAEVIRLMDEIAATEMNSRKEFLGGILDENLKLVVEAWSALREKKTE